MVKKNRILSAGVLTSILACLLVLTAVLWITLGKSVPNTTDETAVQEGVAFLSSLEQADPGQIRQTRQELYERRMQEQKETLTKQIKKGDIDPFPLFQDYVVMGDSRAIGFYYSDFLEESRIIAKGGHTILAIEGKLKKLKRLNPSYVFLCYGLNDVSIGYWDSGEEHAKEYMKNIKDIQEALPDATIVVSSILPTTKAAYSVSSRWKEIPQWNEALKAACKENGILFADCDWIYEKHSNLWVSDGQHFRPAVYPYWGGQLILTALYGEVENETQNLDS